LPPKGSKNRGGERNKIHADVQHKPTGYEPGYFAGWMSQPTEDGPDGFPPFFKSRLTVTVPRVAMLQTIQRRESDSATGKGYGAGTCVMPNTSTRLRPGFMGKLPGVAA
jgi:hypothetical protein